MVNCRDCRVSQFCLLFIIFINIAIGISALCLCLVIFHGPARQVERSYDFSKNESRLLNYSSIWCSHVSVTSMPYVDMTFYLLKDSPPLTDHDEFEVTSEAFDVLINNVTVHKFYLYPGSHINVTTCVADNDSADVTFFYILGEKNFLDWQCSQYMDSSTIDTSFKIPYCWEDSKKHNLFIRSEVAAYYYMVYLKTSPNYGLVSINNLFQVYRTKLMISRSNVIQRFSSDIDYETLYLDVAYKQSNPIAVAVNPPDSSDKSDGKVWLDVYTIIFKCQDRYVLYILIGIALGLASLPAATLAAASIYMCVCHKRATRRGLYATLNATETKSYEAHYNTT